ncbi:CRISPR-associated endonuclease Cas1, NMENI subtype [Kandleria vitulina DSM 20405]|jgi:CRISPR-associated endonuclease Cas1 subtype II|uniref:CRISPR-associated endonuclease Cas1 n=2 Tax=Kandleria vitulina TaxID=1630 RepID=A0A0R2HPN0_9FIRM|nr:type II CRISPR-associated endonuclease Cas1 [Kandleria vitulina]KRN51508.1 CRISPR-associated endonuclease Cas1, NMENI subtype [Kandleria vitulina DSM 20405]
MSWRIVVIDSKAKLTYKNDYLVVRNDNIRRIHLSEINTVIVNSTAVVITSYLINELIKRKIKIIFCDETRSPAGEIMPYYGCHNSSKRINEQLYWDKEFAVDVWTRIIKEKIHNQSIILKHYGEKNADKLDVYIEELQRNDETNREGHAAKVYFDTLFGMSFKRDDGSDLNAALNYGYTVLLSQFNRDIVAYGYLTQLGIKHRNEFNPYNLSSDLMEPFRPLIDKIVRDNIDEGFDGAMKIKLIDVLNQQVVINRSKQYVSNAIAIYVKSVFQAIKKHNLNELKFIEYEL